MRDTDAPRFDARRRLGSRGARLAPAASAREPAVTTDRSRGHRESDPRRCRSRRVICRDAQHRRRGADLLPRSAVDGRAALHHYDLSKRKDEVLIPQLSGYELSADGKKMLYNVGEQLLRLARREGHRRRRHASPSPTSK